MSTDRGLGSPTAVPAAWRLILVVALFAAASGCSRHEYLLVRHNPRSPLAEPLRLNSWRGPRPSERTQQTLRAYDLEHLDPDDALAELTAYLATDPSPNVTYALAELAFITGRRAQNDGHTDRAHERYILAVFHAYHYLFDPKLSVDRNPYDPQYRLACDVYNAALESALRLVCKRDELLPGRKRTLDYGGQRFEVSIVARGAWRNDDFGGFEFVSDFDVEKLRNRHHTYGLGVPLIALRRTPENAGPDEAYYPPGLSFPVTAFLRVHHVPDPTQGPCQCVLELFDPLTVRSLEVEGRQVPLETDVSTPLAYFLDAPALRPSRLLPLVGFFDGNAVHESQGLYMLEPYDPQKIPVVMVHGLWSSPLTWMEMFNDLRADADVRQQYQFWFYLYPTGQPFWISAAQMREQLAQAKQRLDPQDGSRAMNQMVLVGHSMGGLVSRMQTLESGDDYWNILTDRPFADLKTTPEIRDKVARTVYFHPNPMVRRVITIGTPHRGSEYANDTARRLSRKLVRLPSSLMQVTNQIALMNPGFFHDTKLLTTTTSIDSLAPSSPILPVMLSSRRAPWTTYHNIVGLVPEESVLGKLSERGDGVVTYDSAHVEDAASEVTVPADHVTVHRHPLAIREVRRILREHQAVVLAEWSAADNQRVLPATHLAPARR